MEPRRVRRGRCPGCGQQVAVQSDGTAADHGGDDLCAGSGLPVLHVRELGNAAAAAELCIDPKTGTPITASTFQWYIAQKKPAGNLPPAHVLVDDDTSQRLYDLDEVRAWHHRRKGRGNWGGIGARARKVSEVTCNYCAQTVGVTAAGTMRDHCEHDGRDAPRCEGSGEPAPTRPDVSTPDGEPSSVAVHPGEPLSAAETV